MKYRALVVVSLLLVMFSLSSCNTSSKQASTLVSRTRTPGPTPTPVPTHTPVPTPIPTPDFVGSTLIFTGKLVDSKTGVWPNDRLVVLYLKGDEIGRTISSIGENPVPELNKEGLTDGYFQIEIPNTYEIASNQFDFRYVTEEPHYWIKEGNWFDDTDFMNTWLGSIEVGELYEIPVASKNLSYHMKIFTSDITNLPPEIMEENSTRLSNTGQVVLNLTGTDQASGERILIQGITFEDKQDIVEIEKNTILINNCGGNSPVTQEYSSAEIFYNEYKTETMVGADIDIPTPIGWPKILVELEAKYGFEQGQINSQEVSYSMEAQSKTRVTYIITWSEVWESGIALVETDDGSLEVPFRVRTNIIYDIDSESFDCD